ncbi:hypothetical protein, partial [Streptomyces scabiei]|uniref:hypothetical protein n=1 Tax=Streptomyces scabiei TaxID=1930 RepID=UPI001C500744
GSRHMPWDTACAGTLPSCDACPAAVAVGRTTRNGAAAKGRGTHSRAGRFRVRGAMQIAAATRRAARPGPTRVVPCRDSRIVGAKADHGPARPALGNGS